MESNCAKAQIEQQKTRSDSIYQQIDIELARVKTGEGKEWVDRLEAAMKAGTLLPALGLRCWGIVLRIVPGRTWRLKDDHSAPMHDLDWRAVETVMQIHFSRGEAAR